MRLFGTTTTSLRLLCITVILCLLKGIDSVLAASVAQNGGHIASKEPNPQTWTIANDDPNVAQYANLIDIFEELNILRSGNGFASCVTLEKIVRNVTSINPTQRSRTVGIYLVFHERRVESHETHLLNSGLPSTQSSSHGNGGVNNAVPGAADDKKLPCTDILPADNGNMGGLGTFSMKGGDIVNVGTNDTGYGTDDRGDNVTGAVQMHEGGHAEKNAHGGLSRTQVVVIATCSAVIGTFFLIAAAMRIRNYIKRYRDERAVRNGRRTSNYGFPGSNNGSGNLRRDSSTSRTSRQGDPVIKGGGNIQVVSNKAQHFTHNSSPTHCADHNPLLPVQFVPTNDARGTSSTASLAYIDEDSYSQPKADVTSGDYDDDDTEDHPLLRKSPDSGSSADVIMDDDDDVEFGNQSEVSLHLHSELDCTPCGGSESEERLNLTEKHTCSTDELYDTLLMSRMSSIDTELLDLENSVPADDQNDLDDFEQTEFIDNCPDLSHDTTSELLICHVDQNECNTSFAESNSVNIGLSQSNSSLSNNPSYCYGNQTEYGPYGRYGNVAYSCPFACKTDVNTFLIPDNGLRLNTASLDEADDDVPEAVSEPIPYTNCDGESVTRQSLTPSDLVNMNLSKENSGEPLLGDCSQVSNAGQDGPAGADNPAMQDSGDDETGSTFSTYTPVQSQIVPLSEYRRTFMCSDSAQLRQDN